MKKCDVYVFPVGSPEFVVAHARYKESRGKRPSMPYNGERNPKKALMMATVDAVENAVRAPDNWIAIITYAQTLGTHEAMEITPAPQSKPASLRRPLG